MERLQTLLKKAPETERHRAQIMAGRTGQTTNFDGVLEGCKEA